MTRKTAFLGAVASIVLALTAVGAVAADDGENSGRTGNQLAGTWIVTVNRPAPLPPLKTLQVFTGSGEAIVVDNDSPATHTAQYGAWERIKRRLYASTGLFFRFNAQGGFVGSQKIDRTIALGHDGNTFEQVARVTVLDPNDVVLATFVARATGVRMQIDRIPDEP